MNNKEQVAGIDVSKATLDVAVLPAGEVLQFANDVNGIEDLGKKLKSAAVDLVVMEATGGYETAVATALVGAGLRVAIERSTRSRSAPLGTTRDRPCTRRSRGRGRLSYADRLQNTIRRKAAREMIIISWFRSL